MCGVGHCWLTDAPTFTAVIVEEVEVKIVAAAELIAGVAVVDKLEPHRQ